MELHVWKFAQADEARTGNEFLSYIECRGLLNMERLNLCALKEKNVNVYKIKKTLKIVCEILSFV